MRLLFDLAVRLSRYPSATRITTLHAYYTTIMRICQEFFSKREFFIVRQFREILLCLLILFRLFLPAQKANFIRLYFPHGSVVPVAVGVFSAFQRAYNRKQIAF